MNNNNNFLNICWKMFEKTGKIKYYLLYKNVKRAGLIKKEEYGNNNNKSNSTSVDTFSRL